MTAFRVTEKPATLNLEPITPGMPWAVTIYLWDENKDGLNIDGYEAALTVKDRANGKTYMALTVGDGITRNVADGAFAVLASASDTSGIDVARVMYWFSVTDTNGIETPYLKGSIPVEA